MPLDMHRDSGGGRAEGGCEIVEFRSHFKVDRRGEGLVMIAKRLTITGQPDMPKSKGNKDVVRDI